MWGRAGGGGQRKGWLNQGTPSLTLLKDPYQSYSVEQAWQQQSPSIPGLSSSKSASISATATWHATRTGPEQQVGQGNDELSPKGRRIQI